MNRLVIIGMLIFSVFILFCQKGDEPQKETGIRLIVRGDDIGSSHAANVGCIKSYQEGIMRTVEVMVPCPWFLEAAAMLRENPGLDVGVHLTLTSEWENYKWGPITCAPSLVDSNGNFFPKQKDWINENATDAFWNARPDMQEVEQELRKQIEMAMAHIPQVSHLSGHMGISSLDPKMAELSGRLAGEYGLQIKLNDHDVKGLHAMGSNKLLWEEREQILIDSLETLKPGTYLLVEHPGLDTPEMQHIGHDGYYHVSGDRDGVTLIFSSPRVKEVIKRRNIELISYADLKESE